MCARIYIARHSNRNSPIILIDYNLQYITISIIKDNRAKTINTRCFSNYHRTQTLLQILQQIPDF